MNQMKNVLYQCMEHFAYHMQHMFYTLDIMPKEISVTSKTFYFMASPFIRYKISRENLCFSDHDSEILDLKIPKIKDPFTPSSKNFPVLDPGSLHMFCNDAYND